jgi:hypothetical protein
MLATDVADARGSSLAIVVVMLISPTFAITLTGRGYHFTQKGVNT